MRARFMGTSSKYFIHNKIYNIKTECRNLPKHGACLCVVDINSRVWCPYSRLETMLRNWVLIDY